CRSAHPRRRTRDHRVAAQATPWRIHDPLARALGRRPRRVWSVHLRRPRQGARADPGIRCVGTDANGGRCALALLPLARPARRRRPLPPPPCPPPPPRPPP